MRPRADFCCPNLLLQHHKLHNDTQHKAAHRRRSDILELTFLLESLLQGVRPCCMSFPAAQTIENMHVQIIDSVTEPRHSKSMSLLDSTALSHLDLGLVDWRSSLQLSWRSIEDTCISFSPLSGHGERKQPDGEFPTRATRLRVLMLMPFTRRARKSLWRNGKSSGSKE